MNDNRTKSDQRDVLHSDPSPEGGLQGEFLSMFGTSLVSLDYSYQESLQTHLPGMTWKKSHECYPFCELVNTMMSAGTKQ